jgi:hypothetical protein
MKIKSTPKTTNHFQNQTSQPNAQNKSLDSQQTKMSKQQLQQIIRERQKLKAAEYLTQDPLRSHIKQRGELVSRRIAQFQRKNPGR